ncbi:NAD-dependent epimerase/dehydratase family protein [Pseudactinotalea sp. Z1732]|uniref:NAD-dependent epimerase/dehydratase family protein n=1 Tax=Micrococcales TaxID=85006 RepID=UPI003C7BFCE3
MSNVLGPQDRVLVVGSSGFVGVYVQQALSSAGIDFVRFDLFPDPSGEDTFIGDVRDTTALTEAMTGCTAVLNLAAAHHDFGIDSGTFESVNIGGARSVCAAMEHHDITNLCFFSTVAVYGVQDGVPDEHSVPAPVNDYGRTKLGAEQIYLEWESTVEGRRALIIRPAVVFGPGNFANVFRLIQQIHRRTFLPVGSGANRKSMCYVENLVAAVQHLWGAPPQEDTGPFEVYNYVDEPDLTSREVVGRIYAELGRRQPRLWLPLGLTVLAASPFDLVARVTGRNLPITSERIRKLAGMETRFAAERIRQTGFAPSVSLTEGLRRTVRWYRKSGRRADPVVHLPPEGIVRRTSSERTPRVAAVVVTYNRAELLRHCLDALAEQRVGPAAVVVIDNNSTDGSGEVARSHRLGADVMTLPRNVGGAGGFAAGMARALARHSPDWLWLMDDDTIPGPGALEELLKVSLAFPRDLSVLSSRAVWTDGRVHPMNVSRERVGGPATDRRNAAAANSRVIRTASFVSILIRGQEARRHGLPLADYFIWGDDTEYSSRLLREGVGLQVAGSVVEHRTAEFASWQNNPGQRFYYEVRNKIWLLTRSPGLRVWERLLYGGSAAVGWVRTLLFAPQRAAVVKSGIRGFWKGITTSPKPTATVLDGMGEVTDDVRLVERAAAGSAQV